MFINVHLAFFFFLQYYYLSTISSAQTNTSTIKPGCSIPNCGRVEIPYPFGVGDNCAMNPNFNLTCEGNQLKIQINAQNRHVYSINISDSTLITSNNAATICYNSFGPISLEFERTSFNLSGTPFTFSTENLVFLIGCDDYAEVFWSNTTGVNFIRQSYKSLCSSVTDAEESVSGSCSDNNAGCSEREIPTAMKYYEINIHSGNNHRDFLTSNPCGFAFLGQEDGFRFRGLADLNDKDFAEDARSFPVVLDWVINGDNFTSCAACKSVNSVCTNDSFSGAYTCSCTAGYQGNPYLTNGCTDIDECNGTRPCDTKAHCQNTAGSYRCICPKGYYGHGRGEGSCIRQFPIINFALGVGLGTLFLLIGVTWMYFGFKRRKLMRMREEFFKKNGGLLLQNRTSSINNGTEPTRVFTIEELKKATNGFSDDTIIGRGGHGMVYKGILPDNHIVAIKKAIITDEMQIEPFINEVTILTQVNHRNIVKLHGCCLETEVPLLVYEFVANGTLSFHIHHGGINWLSWNNRLRIATEAAGALAYLHSSASMPIFHRDVKSTNILIDENYTAKISDFGASRLVAMDQAQVTTLVQGTLGYLDPEYFHTSQLTEKSDVYSFGVVLAEILTGQKALCMERSMNERSLSTYFLTVMKENRLFQILDPRVLREGTLDQLQAIGELVKKCLNLHGEDRPSMKVVAAELGNLMKFNTQPWIYHEEIIAGSIGGDINVSTYDQDLYATNSLSPPSTISDVSRKYNLDTAQLLFGLNTPR